jgi:cobalamin transport system substrate-binding protein
VTRKTLFLALILSLMGCDIGRKEPEKSATPPQRVISLLPSATELVFSVGKGDRIVAVTLNDNYPPQVAKLPKVGDQTIDLEKVLALKPDLVIMDSGFNQDKAQLERVGIKVLELRCERITDIAPAMKRLGGVFDCLEEASIAASSFEKELAAFEPVQIEGTVFVEIWGDPLMTVGSETLISDALALLGVENCYQDQTGYFQVDPEDVMSRHPQWVILPQTTENEASSRAAELCRRVGLSPKVVKVNPDLLVRPGPRILEGLQALRNSLSKLH